MNGACNSTIYFGPSSGALRRGQISLNFNYKVNFKVFLFQTLCVFSEIKDVKHIKRDFHSIAWVQGVGLWVAGVPRGTNEFFFEHGHVAYQIEGDDEQDRMQLIFWTLVSNW